MTDLNRINELYRKSRETGLTEAETAEQARLRREYLDGVRRSLTAQLDNTYWVDEAGVKTKLAKKDEAGDEPKDD